MPKRFYILSVLTAAFLATACTETGPDKPVVTPGISNGGGCLDTLYSYLERPGNGTRVNLSQDSSDGALYHLNWEIDDKIQVVCAGCTKPHEFTPLNGDGTKNGSFTGTLPTGTYNQYYAVLNSANASVSTDGNSVVKVNVRRIFARHLKTKDYVLRV